LLDTTTDGSTLIRDLFFQLGKGVELRYEVIEAQKESQELQNAFIEQSSELQRQAAIAQEQIRTWENKWADLEAGFTWKALKKIQAVRLRLAPIGSAQDRFIRRFVWAIMLWRQEGFTALLKRLRNRIAIQPAMIAVRNDAEAKKVEPIVSIVIPVFNAIEMTKLCLESIYRSEINNPFEIIIVDNASTDGTSRWVSREQKKHSQLKYFNMGKNMGFGPAVNYGIRKSKGDFIVILNNDTIVSSSWLENLIAHLEEDTSVGIISPITNYVGEGSQIDAHAQHLMPDLDAINAYARNLELRSQLYYEPNRLVFFCVALRRDLIDKIGYLDESYEKGNFEDDDYCLRARMAGFRLAIAENSFVYHHGSATFKKNRISHSEYMQRNRERFYKKAGRISTTVPLFTSRSELTRKDVSVIVRTKDRPSLLRRTLASLANQTYKDFEVVLVNDGGEDVSEFLKMFESHYATQYVYHQTSKGRTAAINAGIKHSQGKWISYLDDDDIIYPWHLEALIQALKSSGKKFVYSNYNRSLFLNIKMHSPNVLAGTPPWEYSRKELLIQNHIPIHTWMHDRECVDKVGFWDEKFDRLEDYDFLLRISAEYDLFHLRKFTCEYRYYVESANSIYTDREKTVEALVQIYNKNKVEDATSLARRQEVIDTLTKQTQRIENLKSQIGVNLSEAAANREIIRLVVGI
jgi:GT2 family glycosyltransferase